MNSPVTLIKPGSGDTTYEIAGEIFLSYWQQITGNRINELTDADEIPDNHHLIVLGDDTVNAYTERLIQDDIIPGLEVRSETDDYQLLSARQKGRDILIVAGGRGRSTIYAVYDFFQQQAGVRYFWDGDRIARLDNIAISNINIVEKPRFEYRGIRYFAHRGLHRFQAEHWDFDDWKREIDWMLKKRLNFFMLRIGLDDLFQRAFKDIVPYPPEDGVDPQAIPRSYNDRTSFWPLRQRGMLRKKVLHYAFERGLYHPEDAGTVTHWYSRTPQALLDEEKITFTNQKSSSYNDPSGLVWNIHDPKSWDRYWKLTETHIREFGKPDLFHTIGLAERTYGENSEENLKLKIWSIQKINQMIREHYPNAPLMIASWDFMSTWKCEEVRELIKKLDPAKTIILDYTADVIDPKENIFTNWDVIGKFPWIFGIFQGLAPNTDMRGDYRLINQRLEIAVNDPACKGMAYWPEFSHGDSFMLEYFTANAWSGKELSVSDRVCSFCGDRYPAEIVPEMTKIWNLSLKISQTRNWTRNEEFPLREINGVMFFNILTSPWLTKIDEKVIDAIEYHQASLDFIVENVSYLLTWLPEIFEQYYDDEFIRRDIIDIARTAVSRMLHALFLKLASKMEQWRNFNCDEEEVFSQLDLCEKYLEFLWQILSLHEDFSLNDALNRLKLFGPVNPHAEETLKGNTENGYCRGFFAELFPLIYLPEFFAYKDWVTQKIEHHDRSPWFINDEVKAIKESIQNNFYNQETITDSILPEKSSKVFREKLDHLMSHANTISKELTPAL